MRGLSIVFSDIIALGPIIVRVTGGEFRFSGFALTGLTETLSLSGDAIRFMPASADESGHFNGELKLGLSAAPGVDPVIEIDQQLGMFEQALAARQQQPPAAGAAGTDAPIVGVGPELSAMLRAAGPAQGFPAPPQQPPPAPAVTLAWTTPSEIRKAAASLPGSLKLDGFTG